MEDQKQILKELKELKSLMAQLIGTADLSAKERFSTEAIKKAASEFKKLGIERGEWVEENDIKKYIKTAGWRSGAFIRAEFEFTSFFRRGSHTYFYYKKDLLALGQELKERNVDLARYIDLRADQEKFQKYVATVSLNVGEKPKGKKYKIPEDAKDITTSQAKKPSVDVVRADLKNLEAEFFEYKLVEYIDIYHGNYAMSKHLYRFDRYMDTEVKRRIKRWVENFNMANEVLKMISKKKEEFIPVPEDEQISL